MKDLEALRGYLDRVRRESKKLTEAGGDPATEALAAAITGSAELVAGAIENLTETLEEGITAGTIDG